MQLPISFLELCFYSFAAVTLMSAMMVITSRNSVRAVLFLVLTFVGASGLWILTQAEFLALTLVLVYVGAVMVLFLFVVMMLNLNTAPLKEGLVKYFPLGLGIAVFLIGELVWVYKHSPMVQMGLGELTLQGPEYSNIQHLGLDLYTNYIYPFEVAGVVLLVAIVAAIALTFRGPRHRKKQNISEQVLVSKAERLKLMKDINSDSKLTG